MLFMANVSGQELADGQVVVRNLDVVRGENALFVSMDVDVSALNIATNRELLFVPVLKGESDSVQLPFMIVAGRNRYFYHLRNTPVSDGDVLERAGQANVIRYRASLPFEVWMSKATLAIDERACGCRGEGEDRRVPLLRMEPKVYTPVFVYLPPEVEMVKTREVKGSAYIDFPVNRTEIHEDYRKNPTELRKIRQTIDVVREDPDVRITALSIKGYASPEGTYANNTRLAKGRTATLKTYVRELYHFPDSVILTSYSGAYPCRFGTGCQGKDDKIDLPGGLPVPVEERVPGTSALGLRGEIRGTHLHGRGRDPADHENPATEIEFT